MSGRDASDVPLHVLGARGGGRLAHVASGAGDRGRGRASALQSELSGGSVSSLARESGPPSQRGGLQLERTRHRTVLADQWLLGEELGRGAYGQARAGSLSASAVALGLAVCCCATHLPTRALARSTARLPPPR